MQRRGGDRLDAGLERGVNHRGEGGVVVGGNVLRNEAGLLRGAVGVGIGGADLPEHREDVPLGAEGSKVLAGRNWAASSCTRSSPNHSRSILAMASVRPGSLTVSG